MPQLVLLGPLDWIGLRDPTWALVASVGVRRMTYLASFLVLFVKCILEPICHRFWSQLGAHVGSILGPCWALLPILSSVHVEIGPSAPYPIIYNTRWPSGHPKSGPKSIKNRPKRASKSISKVIEKHVEFGIDFFTIFGPFWPPTWGGPGVERIRFSGSSWLPEPPWGPNGSQASSKLDFWAILIDF